MSKFNINNDSNSFNMSNASSIINTFISKASNTLALHGMNTGYLMYRLLLMENYTPSDIEEITNIASIHDISCDYEVDLVRLSDPDPKNTYMHCLRGYLFLKYFSPFKKYAKVLLYHHAHYEKMIDDKFFKLGLKMHLCDRVDVLVRNGYKDSEIIDFITKRMGTIFSPTDVYDMKKLITEDKILDSLRNENYKEELEVFFKQFTLNKEKEYKLLYFLAHIFEIYNIDTLEHSKNTAVIASMVATAMRLSKDDIRKVYIAGILHDLGKIGIPKDILEYPGRLNTQQMEVMRKHIWITKDIIEKYFPEDIVSICFRHHERLDGSGYPLGLKAESLTICDRILQFTDVVSALYGVRSYKDAYDYDRIEAILKLEVSNNKLDKNVYIAFEKNHNLILSRVEKNKKKSNKIVYNLKNEYTKYLNKNTWCD